MANIYAVTFEVCEEGIQALRDAVFEYLDRRDLPLEKGDTAELHEKARSYVMRRYSAQDADFRARHVGKVVRCANMM